MLTTRDAGLAELADRLRNHGAGIPEEERHSGPAPYLMPEFDEFGFNYRMTDLQAAVGLVQLAKLSDFVAERDHWARWYSDQLAELEWLQTPEVPPDYGARLAGIRDRGRRGLAAASKRADGGVAGRRDQHPAGHPLRSISGRVPVAAR